MVVKWTNIAKLCQCLENISLPIFEKISYSHGEATQFEYIIWRNKFAGNKNLQENNIKLCLKKLFRELENWNLGGTNGDEQEEPQPSEEDLSGNRAQRQWLLMGKPENFSLGPSQEVFSICHVSISNSALWEVHNTKIVYIKH